MPFGVVRPDLHFWTIHSFSCENGLHGHEFSIFVSKDFLDTVKRLDCDETAKKVAQDVTRQIANTAGILGLEGVDLLTFGELGVHQFTYPHIGGRSLGGSSGVWLSIEPSGSGEKGAIYASHNCDKAAQQSLLLAMWKNWANFVECFAEESVNKS